MSEPTSAVETPKVDDAQARTAVETPKVDDAQVRSRHSLLSPRGRARIIEHLI